MKGPLLRTATAADYVCMSGIPSQPANCSQLLQTAPNSPAGIDTNMKVQSWAIQAQEKICDAFLSHPVTRGEVSLR